MSQGNGEHRIDGKLRSRFIDGIRTIFGAIVGGPDFVRDYAVCLLFESPILLTGAPGVGKTTLARATARVLFGEEAVILTCYEEAGPEDLIFDMDIGKVRENGGSRFHFAVKPRPFLTKPFALVNEVNRLPKGTQNTFLGVFSEGTIDVRGARLRKAPGKVLLDLNPYYGELDLAFRDRMVACLHVDELGVAEQLTLALRKYQDRHVEDLVSTLTPMLSAEDMRAIWEDVRSNVTLASQDMAQVLLAINVFRSCKYRLGSISESFREQIRCEDCTLKKGCVTKMLRRPVLTRLLDSVVMLAKGYAWLDGRDAVDVVKDLYPALRLGIAHRAELREEIAQEQPSTREWFDRAVKPLLRSRKAEWARARKVYTQIEKAVSKDDIPAAGRVLKRYLASATDVTARCMLEDFAGPDVAEGGREVFEKTMETLDLMLSGKASYTVEDLEKLEAGTDWLPEAQLHEIKDAIEALRFRMTGTATVDADAYRDLVRGVAALDPAAVRTLLPINSNGGRVTHQAMRDAEVLGDLVVIPQNGHIEVQFRAMHSGLADVMAEHGAE